MGNVIDITERKLAEAPLKKVKNNCGISRLIYKKLGRLKE